MPDRASRHEAPIKIEGQVRGGARFRERTGLGVSSVSKKWKVETPTQISRWKQYLSPILLGFLGVSGKHP
jgi:hypothetical protein